MSRRRGVCVCVLQPSAGNNIQLQSVIHSQTDTQLNTHGELMKTENELHLSRAVSFNDFKTMHLLVCFQSCANRVCLCVFAPLSGDLESFKKQSFVLKEGVEYRIKISFKVNKEIVSGLKYVQQTFRKGVKIDKTDYMVGSYGPRPDEYEFLTPLEEAPKGMLARGTYNIKSKFTDDDKHDHLSWEWNLNIKKEWKD
uniref:Rho GDP-dissociation inhibitor 1 n=1 Tax=Cyprinus carpio carpio TaxID=630221 RepID=A0A9J7XT63_CYPCA